MSKVDRVSLLKFLSKPRLVNEVAKHYGISKKLANFHLLEAVKSGQVLISEKPIVKALGRSKAKLKPLKGFTYVSRNSATLVNGWKRFANKEDLGSQSTSKNNAISVKFVSETHSLLGENMSSQKFPDYRDASLHLRTEGLGTAEFDVSTTKVKLGRKKTVDQMSRRKQGSASERAKTLTHLERMHLFQALSKKPLPYMDLHERFGVSKKSIRSLVKNGLLMEVWGPRSIGLRFKLTEKGKIALKRLEAAAKMQPKIKKSAVIRLKQRTFV